MKHSLSFVRRVLLGVCLLLTLSTLVGRAQDPDPAAPTPSLTPRPRPKPKPTPDASLPVGTVNGVAIYRPLMKSLVTDPLDRALLIYDFDKRQGRLSDAQVDEAVRGYKRDRFSNNDTALNARLGELGATPDDFRRFVGEEAKLRLELANITRASVSDESAQRAQRAYVAGLRQQARINQPKH